MIADAKTKIVLLDDDSSFLDVASFYLESKFKKTVAISTFNSSERFLNHINNHCYLPESPQDIIHSFYSSKKTHNNIAQTLKDLAELPAMLIIDHQLSTESTNGIEVAQKVREYIPSSFIAMLTSQVNTQNALSLHNNQIIDLFIRKDELNPMDVVYFHLKRQIEKVIIESNINPEDAFGFETILEDKTYISKREGLLNETFYKAYLTVSSNGEIALLDLDDQIRYYGYRDEAFRLNG